MAKIKILGAPKKTRVTAKQIAEHRERAKRDPSPRWDGCEEWNTEQFNKAFREAMNYYRLEHSGKDLKPQIIKWMAANSYDKEVIAQFKKTKDTRCGVTMGAIASCLLKGMPAVREDFNNGRDTSEWLKNEILRIINDGRDDIDEDGIAAANASKPTVAQPSIQDRIRDAAFKMIDELEEAYHSYQLDPETFDPKAFKVVNLLRNKEAKATHARIIKEYYSRDLADLRELASGTKDEQLREGYSHRPRKHIKKLIEFLTEVESACDMLQEEAKVTRKPRVKRPTDKAKLVSKLKYKKQDDALKLVSINPVEIIGAKELWVYNTKIRKIGKYIAAEFSDLGIKGTTITGFDENRSVHKTLRKPIEQLKTFKEAGKIALRKFLDEINSVDTKMNGRISEDIILLKVS